MGIYWCFVEYRHHAMGTGVVGFRRVSQNWSGAASARRWIPVLIAASQSSTEIKRLWIVVA